MQKLGLENEDDIDDSSSDEEDTGGLKLSDAEKAQIFVCKC
jgi:hypothetical protein